MSVVNEFKFYLDSKYRTNGTNPSPEFALKTPLVISNPNHYFVACVKSVDIPYSFKTLSAPYNTLKVNYLEQGHANATGTITIAEGNYSITNLLEELKTKLLAFINTTTFQHIPDFIFTYDRSTGRVTLGCSKLAGSNITTVTLYWSDANVDILAEFFGFTGNTNTTIGYLADGTSSSTNNVSEINVNCSPVSSIYIRSGSLSQPATNEEFLVEFDQSVSDVLLKIPINVPYGSWIMWQNESDEVRINNKIVDVLQLYLTHLSYSPISLNGVHWKCHLTIKEIKPAFVEEIERAALENEQKIREMQSTKDSLLDELQNLSASMKPTMEAPAPESDNVDQMKNDFINTIAANKAKQLS